MSINSKKLFFNQIKLFIFQHPNKNKELFKKFHLLAMSSAINNSKTLDDSSVSVNNNKSPLKTSNKCKIGICQITSTHDKTANIKICIELIEKAKHNGAKVVLELLLKFKKFYSIYKVIFLFCLKMVFLPEAFDYIDPPKKEDSIDKSEPLNGELMQKFSKIALDNRIWLSLGGYHRHVINSFILIALICYFDKFCFIL